MYNCVKTVPDFDDWRAFEKKSTSRILGFWMFCNFCHTVSVWPSTYCFYEKDSLSGVLLHSRPHNIVHYYTVYLITIPLTSFFQRCLQYFHYVECLFCSASLPVNHNHRLLKAHTPPYLVYYHLTATMPEVSISSVPCFRKAGLCCHL